MMRADYVKNEVMRGNRSKWAQGVEHLERKKWELRKCLVRKILF